MGLGEGINGEDSHEDRVRVVDSKKAERSSEYRSISITDGAIHEGDENTPVDSTTIVHTYLMSTLVDTHIRPPQLPPRGSILRETVSHRQSVALLAAGRPSNFKAAQLSSLIWEPLLR